MSHAFGMAGQAQLLQPISMNSRKIFPITPHGPALSYPTPGNRAALCLAKRGPQLLLMALLALCVMANSALYAANVSTNAMNRARAFLETTSRGSEVLGYVHLGATYQGHQYVDTRGVVDAGGREIPGRFALVYRFSWDKDGSSDVGFLCDSNGRVYGVRIVSSNAILQQPFFFANKTIQVLGNLVISALKDNMSEEETNAVQQFVNEADAKGLLELVLRLEQ